MSFPDDALSCDDFLGGRLRIWQPMLGYRAATDPVFLAAACPAKPGDSVLELGCGVGTASLCLGHRVNVSLTGVERQQDYAELCKRNAVQNDQVMDVICADLTALPQAVTAQVFDQVILNPPFYGPGTASTDGGRNQALREDTPLAVWIECALRRLKPKGWLTVIHLSERLPDILLALNLKAGAIDVKPLQAREGRPAKRILLRARKGARAPFTLRSPLILHEGPSHEEDGDSFRAEVREVLRGGKALCFYQSST